MKLMLDALREEIDAIDGELVTLFCRRMDVAAEIAAYKQARGLRVRDPAREQAVLDKVAAMAGEPYARYVQTLYGTMFETSRAYQHSLMDADE